MNKKLLFMLAISLILIIALSGCNKKDASTNDTTKPVDNETSSADNKSSTPVKVKVFALQYPDTDWNTNSFTKFVEGKFNIAFDWETVPFDGAAEKRQISLASGNYPDLYMLIPGRDNFSQIDLLRYSKQGVIIPLNELIDKYGPNIKAALDSHPYFKAMNTAPDGNIYGLTQLIECFHCSYPSKTWINTKWLDTLKLDMPKTLDEYRNVLRAFKTKDPNGNSKADEVPLSGSTEPWGVHVIPFIMNGFIYDDDNTYLMLKDGKVDFAANKQEWKQGLEYVKSMYDEGLIDPGSFTQNYQAFAKIGNNEEAEILGAGAGMHPAIFVAIGSESIRSRDYNVLPPLQGPTANYAVYNYPVTAGASFVLTNKASNEVQVAAIKLLDSMFTQEGHLRAYFGEEGLDWRKPDSGEVALEEAVKPIFAEIPTVTGDKPHNSSWKGMGQYYQTKEIRDGWVQDADIYSDTGYERRLQEATNLYKGKEPKNMFPHWAIWIDPSIADEIALLKTNIKNYIDQNALLFVTGKRNISKDWDDYVKGLENLNSKRYLEIMQHSYDQMSK